MPITPASGSLLHAGSHTTYYVYEITCRCHLVPKLGKVTLDQLSPIHIKNAYKKFHDTGLAPKTLKNIHGVLHGALKQAFQWHMIATNPADQVEPPRYVRPEVQTAEHEQLRQILDRLRGREWYLPTLIAFATGMRRGEVLALQWQDFNEEARVLIVRRSLARIRDSEIILKETKSGRTRVVAIPDALVKELVDHRKQSAFTKPTDWISCRKDGAHLAPGGLSLAFRRAANKQKLSISFHSIRHTQATLLLSAGVPVKTVSERLGHSTVSLTQDLYAHVLPHMQRQAADVIESTIFNTDKVETQAEE